MEQRTESKTFTSTENAREAVRALELDGIDPSHINLDTPAIEDVETMVQVDRASVRRPARRYILGALTAAAAMAAIILAIDLTVGISAPVLLPAVIAAFLCGGLFGLYSKLSMHRHLPAADASGPVQIRIPEVDHRRSSADIMNT